MKNSALLLVCSFLGLSSVAAQTPNWSEDVACIIYSNCSSCHSAGGIAPFPLLSYDHARIYASAIKEVISEGNMPPWPPDPDYRPLADERMLTEAEIQTIIDWVDGGTPAGDLNTAPEPPIAQGDEAIHDPDLVVQLPEYTSRAVNGDEYRCFVVPSNLLENRFITGFEVVPGNRNIVHHVLVFQDDSNVAQQLDDNDPDPGYLCFGGVGSFSAKMIGAWVPGQGAQFLPAGLGIELPANSNIVIQLHYPEGSAGEKDATKINFKFSDRTDLRKLNVDFVLNHFTTMVNGPLYIPANTVKTFQQEYRIPFPVTVIGTAPHMHLIGRSIRSWAELPNGTEVPLIDIPDWDFEWQGFYRFREPVSLPAGTYLRAEAVYDNTRDNPHNPNDPPLPLSVGEATTDEMMLVTFTWMLYRNGDENLSLDPEIQQEGYACNALSTGLQAPLAEDASFSIFPNPGRSQIQLQLENNWRGRLELKVFNALGQMVGNQIIQKENKSGRWFFDPTQNPAGVYYFSLSNGRETVVRKWIHL